MSDLDTSLRALRDDLRGTLTRPDLSRVADRARQQRVRRRMQLGAIVAVVLVSVAVPVMRMVPSGHAPAQPSEDQPPPFTVDFADTDHGYAFRQDCESQDGPCEFALRVTADGGGTWRAAPLPKGDETYVRGGVLVLGTDEVWFTRATAGMPAIHEQYMSDDGGRTWRDMEPRQPGSPVVVSTDGLLNTVCVASSADSSCVLGLATRALDGISPVFTQPPLRDPVPGTTSTAGGRHWAAGRAQNSENWAISVTSDGGRNWATTALDLRGTPQLTAGAWSVAERGDDMYLTVVGNVGVGPLELLAVFRSTDKGVSWTRRWQSTENHELQAVTGDAVATADGQLLVYSRVVGTVASRDGGSTFTKAEHQLPGPVTWTRAGYLSAGPDNVFELSRDGVGWRRFEVR